MENLEFITVTLNPAIDQTIFVEDLTPGAVHRAKDSHRQAGGKGINVATMLSLYGKSVAVTGFLGASNPSIFSKHFKEYGLRDEFIRVGGETRTGIKIVDTISSETTDINLLGPSPLETQQRDLVDRIQKIAKPGMWVVLAGSLPKNVKPEYMRTLIKAVHSAGSLVAVDSSGEALATAIDAGADLVKPNVDELSEYLGEDLTEFSSAVAAAKNLHREKIPNLVVSLGGQGALFLTPDAELMAGAPKVKVISTVGAGDSMLAGVLAGISQKSSPADCARLATVFAWSRLQMLQPYLPGKDVIQRQMAQIPIQPLNRSVRSTSVQRISDPNRN